MRLALDKVSNEASVNVHLDPQLLIRTAAECHKSVTKRYKVLWHKVKNDNPWDSNITQIWQPHFRKRFAGSTSGKSKTWNRSLGCVEQRPTKLYCRQNCLCFSKQFLQESLLLCLRRMHFEGHFHLRFWSPRPALCSTDVSRNLPCTTPWLVEAASNTRRSTVTIGDVGDSVQLKGPESITSQVLQVISGIQRAIGHTSCLWPKIFSKGESKTQLWLCFLYWGMKTERVT